MSGSDRSQIRTRMFARALGPYFTIVPTTVAIRGSYMQTLFTEFKANPMWPWLYGAILLMGGLLIIAFHQYWRSPAAIIVSVLGWFLAIRGVLLLTVPQAYNAGGRAGALSKSRRHVILNDGPMSRPPYDLTRITMAFGSPGRGFVVTWR